MRQELEDPEWNLSQISEMSNQKSDIQTKEFLSKTMVVDQISEEPAMNIFNSKLQEGFIKLFHKNVKKKF